MIKNCIKTINRQSRSISTQILRLFSDGKNILTGHDDGHLTGVNQKQIGTVHENHVAEHFRSVVAHSAVHVSENK